MILVDLEEWFDRQWNCRCVRAEPWMLGAVLDDLNEKVNGPLIRRRLPAQVAHGQYGVLLLTRC